ncbi:MAG TPA: sensor histidine kinase [Anaerolineales bacterium]|nr:sensor histidine kinase [Anaerolineales bacterium]
MDVTFIVLVYFFYGLAFFSMGLLVALEGGRSSDIRLRKALRPLAGFGIVHALHEWLVMFGLMGHLQNNTIYSATGLSILAFSFISLAAFGSFLLAYTEVSRRLILLIPIALEAIWVFGLYNFRGQYTGESLWSIADTWTRYTLAIPASLLTSIGLVAQQRAFRRSGLIRFGRDALWAAIAFGWYGLFGQIFTQTTPLFPSNIINQELFQNIFGFPIQLFRAFTAFAAAIFVIRFLHAFQVETDAKIADLQKSQLHEAQQRETLRGELFRRVVAAQEAERQRIARDLHDETGQALTAIGMGLRGLTGKISTRNKEAFGTLHKLEALTADSLKELQRLISDLRPSHLDDLGLSAALRWHSNRIQENSAISIRVDIHGEEKELDEAMKIAVFRIIQEALNNIMKHAQASNVNIHLAYDEKSVRINVFDNGIGFDPDQIKQRRTSRPSLGLAGMEERAVLLGGTVSIQSRPGYGTEVEAVIPYQNFRVHDFVPPKSNGNLSESKGVGHDHSPVTRG